MTKETESSPEPIIPPIEYLRECFQHCPETGNLIWKIRPPSHFPNIGSWKRFNKVRPGTIFGSPLFQRTTKRVASICGVLIYKSKPFTVLNHRVAWMLKNGPIPEGLEVDHKDRNASNNLIGNLRLSTHSQNMANATRYRNRKHDLPRGVHKNGKKFSAITRKDRKMIWIGTFDTIEEARLAYLEKAAEIHGVFFNPQ